MYHSKEVQALSIAFLIDILLREQCKASRGYWHKLKLEGTVYSPYLGFRKFIPRAINSHLLSRYLK